MSLRVLMTLDAVGGVWRYAMDLAATLSSRGHTIIFAGLGPQPSTVQQGEAMAIGALEWGRAPLEWMAASPEEAAGVSPWIEDLVRRYRPDVLHLNLPGQAVGLRVQLPVVAIAHSCLATWFRTVEGRGVPRHLAWQALLTSEGLRRADAAVAPSAAHARLTENVHGVDGVKIVPNASAAPLAAPSPGDGTIVAAARWWDPGKNGAVLDAAAALTPVPVELVGNCDGPEGQHFIPAHARSMGSLPHASVMKRLAEASLFVSPSLYEPFGLAALEAARAGRPLLLADIPVYRELWEGAAHFFDPRDPQALANRIDTLIGAPDERIAFGAAAQARARRFTRDDQAEAMESLYRRISADMQATA